MRLTLPRYLLLVTTTLVAISISSARDLPRTLYSLNGSAETLSRLDLESGAIEQNIVQTGQVPNQIVAHDDMLYVVNSGSDNIQVIDPQQDNVVKTIALESGSNPWFMAFTAAQKAYVTNLLANSVSVVDLSSGTILKNIPVGTGPQGILVSGDKALVANTGFSGGYGPASVSVIDIHADSVIKTLDVPKNAQDMARDPLGRIHVICTGDYANSFGQVVVIDLFTGPMWNEPAVVDTITLGGSPGDLEINADGSAYAVAWGDGSNGYLYKYDAISGTVERDASNPILVGPNVSRLYFDRVKNQLWIPTMAVWGGDGFVQKYDTESDSVSWTSAVLGNGVQDLAIMEAIQESDPWADAVYEFTPGIGAGFGQNFFPQNVLGPPDPSAAVNAYSPSSSAEEILSLGNGGEIVLEFTDNQIVNGSGVDFTVFENAFISWDGTVFMEAARVAVSQDAQTWYEFPFDTLDMSGLAGVTPIGDNQQPTNPEVSGGDQFDLETVGLDWARFVRLTDLGDYYQEGLYNGDFDLDAVVAVNSSVTAISGPDKGIAAHDFELMANYPNPFNPQTTIRYRLSETSEVELKVFNALGQRVATLFTGKQAAGTYRQKFTANGLAGGIYFYRLTVNNISATKKMLLVK